MLNNADPTVTIEVTPLNQWPLDELKSEWVRLFAKSDARFFLSWSWIGSWLLTLPRNLSIYVVKASQHSNTVGLAILCEQNVRRHGFVHSRQWYLHRTGNETLDQSWIEYNDFLMASSAAKTLRNNLIESILDISKADELILNLMSEDADVSAVEAKPNYQLITDSQPGYKVALRESGHYTRYSKSLKRAINKTSTILNTLGCVEHRIVEHPADVLNSLNQYRHWHIDKWQETTTPSGFTNSTFTEFHHQLINRSNSDVKIVELSVNGQVVGINYLFVDTSSVYFYLSCIKPFTDNKIKIGLYLHSLSIDWAHQAGYNYYEFLAGDSPYKAKFGSTLQTFSKHTFQNQKIRFRIEQYLSDLKHKIVT